MLQTTLVIMAAGIGSRFGGGIKQLEPVGPRGEIIMDYSIFDALEAGFNRVVFIIRKDIEEDFYRIIGERIERVLGKENVFYVFQELNYIPKEHLDKLQGRKKPWGTGHAVLLCKGVVNTPFAVINADDYYGKAAFVKVHQYLIDHYKSKLNYCMAGFVLGNTLSDNGAVTRGICHTDGEGFLTDVRETKNIIKTGNGAETNGYAIDVRVKVSMNMWGLTTEFLDILDSGFGSFLESTEQGDNGSEYLLPTILGGLITRQEVRVKMLETGDNWFGVTYKEDKQFVKDSFSELIKAGVYPKQLFS